jgi:formate hydrogenlyase subunit 3/multisubunit Na+/H+ antiporter MnhD subunit
MTLLLSALVLLGLTAVAALSWGSSARWSTLIGAGGAILGSLLGLLAAAPVVFGAPSHSVRLPWEVPYGSFFVVLDPLSAFFLLPLFVLSAVTALYGGEYLHAYRERKSLGVSWFFFNLLVASMALVMIARNGVLFLAAWEVMALTSFFLVTFEDEHESVREAGWIYLVATHCGTAFLLVLFLLLGREHGSLDFDQFTASAGADVLFLLAVIGFGAKAGFMPFHVWLPEAHPAAPTHVSALMSGVMIKTGIYGLVRILTFLGPPPLWWGWLFCGIGLSSGILGVLYALAQHDLKRLLAYHSVENIGIIALGLGVGLIGLSSGSATLAVLGFAGGLLHVLNHALFKGLLFLGAGAVMHGAGTREIDHLGGLLKRMPWTGMSFLIGAVAISGLPPLNGFVSELLIYVGAFQGVTTLGNAATAPALAVIAGLALIGGLAAACFAKAFGIVFLGEPRSDHAAHAHEAGMAVRLSLLLLALSCVLIGLCAPWVVKALVFTLMNATGLSADSVNTALLSVHGTFSTLILASLILLVLLTLLASLRYRLLAKRSVTEHVTWDCGYARPTPRMQYTASSFAQPLTSLFQFLLRTRFQHFMTPGLFPHTASLATETEDLSRARLYLPLFVSIGRSLSSLRWVQHGQVHLYVLYVALTLVVLLVWKLG